MAPLASWPQRWTQSEAPCRSPRRKDEVAAFILLVGRPLWLPEPQSRTSGSHFGDWLQRAHCSRSRPTAVRQTDLMKPRTSKLRASTSRCSLARADHLPPIATFCQCQPLGRHGLQIAAIWQPVAAATSANNAVICRRSVSPAWAAGPTLGARACAGAGDASAQTNPHVPRNRYPSRASV